MKKLIIILLATIAFGNSYLFGQTDSNFVKMQDPEAKAALDKLADKIENFNIIEASFEMTYINKREDVNSTSEGEIIIKGDKYILNMLGSKIIYDGENMYSIMEDIKEVTITKPDKDDEDFASNPAKIFSFYNRDFKFRYTSLTKIGNKEYHEIDLYPKNLDQPFSRFKVLIDEETNLLYEFRSYGKEGEDYLVTISDFKFNNSNYSDDDFKFNKEKYQDADIIDMRF